MENTRIPAFSVLIALLLVAATAAPIRAQQTKSRQNFSYLSAATQKALEDAVAHELKTFGGKTSIPGAVVGIWQPGKVPFVRAVGMEDLSPLKPMQLNDRFRIGSNTKTFVITVILQLVDEGKMSLDDPLSKFDIGVKVPNAEHITVRQICQMQSGLFEVY